MNEQLNDILVRCHALAAQFAQTADQHDRDGTFSHENVRAMHEAGLHKLLVPREFGGMGQTMPAAVQVLRIIAQGDASTALGYAMHLHKTGQLAEQQPWEADKLARLWHDIVETGALINSAESEPDMGSPSRGGLHRTTATRTAGGYLINGHKSWITFAPALGYFFISATFDDNGEPRIGVFAVKGGSEGLTVLDNWGDALSVRASGSCDVMLKNVFVPEHWHVQSRDPLPKTNTPSLPAGWSTLCYAAVYLGVGEAALHALSAYAKHRIPTALGKPIATLPHIQRAIGQMAVTLRAARTVLNDVAEQWDSQPDQRMSMAADIAAAKYLCTNAAITSTDIAMRAAGANGLDRKLPLERLLRDARAGLMHPPQDEPALELMGRAALEITNYELRITKEKG